MDTVKITKYIILAAIVGLIGWDIYVAMTPVKGDTISEIMLTFAMSHPVIPFAFGVLFGHLFWSQKVDVQKP